MPVTDNPSSETQEGGDKLQWVYAVSAVVGLAIGLITLYGYMKKGSF